MTRCGPLEWRPLPGMEGHYEVSSWGEVRSLPGFKRRGTVLRAHVTSTLRYPAVGIHLLGHCRNRTVHTLVAETFLGARPPGMQVRHLDGDHLHACATNLAWGTPSENGYDKRTHGTDHNVNKTHCPRGHAYDEHGYEVPSRPGGRYCRACTRKGTVMA